MSSQPLERARCLNNREFTGGGGVVGWDPAEPRGAAGSSGALEAPRRPPGGPPEAPWRPPGGPLEAPRRPLWLSVVMWRVGRPQQAAREVISPGDGGRGAGRWTLQKHSLLLAEH
ncbi:unnamed protein product [Boreogadus saida]